MVFQFMIVTIHIKSEYISFGPLSDWWSVQRDNLQYEIQLALQ